MPLTGWCRKLNTEFARSGRESEDNNYLKKKSKLVFCCFKVGLFGSAAFRFQSGVVCLFLVSAELKL
jgi:hypothetical protein